MTRSDRTPPSRPTETNRYRFDGVGNRLRVSGPDGGNYGLSTQAPSADRPVNQYTTTPFDRRDYDNNGNLIRIRAHGDTDGDADVDLPDFMTGLLKASVFGLILSSLACYHGLRVTGGAAGVGRATTATVVQAVVAVIIADLIFTAIFYSIGWG